MSESKTETTAKKKNGAKKRVPLETKQRALAAYLKHGNAEAVAKEFGLSSGQYVYVLKQAYDAGSLKLPPRRPSAPTKSPRGRTNGAVTIARGEDGDLKHVTLVRSSGLVDVKLYDELREENKALRLALKMALRGDL